MRNALLLIVLVISGVALGLLAALLMAVPGAVYGDRFFLPSGMLLMTGAFYGLMLGYPVGSILGILCMGGVLGSRGSVLMAVLGNVVGATGVYYFARAVGSSFASPEISLLVLALFLALPPLLGSLGYVSFRKRAESFRLI